MDTRRGLGASHFDGGFQEIFGQASEVRRGGLKLGFAVQTLEGIRNSWLMFFPVPSIRVRQGRQNTKTKVETSSFPQPGRFHLPSPRTLISSIVQQQD